MDLQSLNRAAIRAHLRALARERRAGVRRERVRAAT